MSAEDDFRIRPGRIRSTRAQRARPFIAQALAAAQRAGGSVSRKGTIGPGHRSRFGRGQRASVQANRLITSRSRGAVVKARVVRHGARGAPLATHLGYLRREGVTRDGQKALLFGPGTDEADPKAFAERCTDDRHHFRFIVSPDDAIEMADLKRFTRDLVGQMERDLGTRLDWVAVDHWNTEHPHVHLIVRGVRDDGENLVIARDYIKEGMRDRARDLITQELGPRTDRDIRTALERQIEAERRTNLDRQLARDAYRTGIIDLAPHAGRQPDEFHALKVGRLRKLEGLALAEQIGPGQWVISETAENRLRELGERGDIIKRIHRGLAERGLERGPSSYVLAGESLDEPIVGRLLARGLETSSRAAPTRSSTASTAAPTTSSSPISTRPGIPPQALSSSCASSTMPRAAGASRLPSDRIFRSSSRSRRTAPPGSTARRLRVSRSRSAAAASAPRFATPSTAAPSISSARGSPSVRAAASASAVT
jgi:type IV secretory pathway VirD2 relaxase